MTNAVDDEIILKVLGIGVQESLLASATEARCVFSKPQNLPWEILNAGQLSPIPATLSESHH